MHFRLALSLIYLGSIGVNAGDCNADNCLRALQNTKNPGSAFCGTFTAQIITATTAIPTYFSACSSSISRLSSACNCIATTSLTGSQSSTSSSTTTSSSGSSTCSAVTVTATAVTSYVTVVSYTSYTSAETDIFTSTDTSIVTSYVSYTSTETDVSTSTEEDTSTLTQTNTVTSMETDTSTSTETDIFTSTETDVSTSIETVVSTTTSSIIVTSTPTPGLPALDCTNYGLEWAAWPFPTYRGTVIPESYKTQVPTLNGTTKTYTFTTPGDVEPIFGNPTPIATNLIIVDFRGYFIAEQRGTYTFSTDSIDDHFYLWIGSTAYSGWTGANAYLSAFFPTLDLGPELVTYAFFLTPGIYPIRYMWGNTGNAGVFIYTITAPDGTIVINENSQDSPNIVTSCSTAGAPEYPDWGSEQ